MEHLGFDGQNNGKSFATKNPCWIFHFKTGFSNQKKSPNGKGEATFHRLVWEFPQLVIDSNRLVVSNIFYFHPYLGKIPILTNIFQRGWNHQLGKGISPSQSTVFCPESRLEKSMNDDTVDGKMQKSCDCHKKNMERSYLKMLMVVFWSRRC